MHKLVVLYSEPADPDHFRDSYVSVRQDDPMDDHELVSRLIRCIGEDIHAVAYVGDQFGADALLDSHLPMLDLVESLARDWQAMEPTDDRYTGLTHALRVIAQAYQEQTESP